MREETLTAESRSPCYAATLGLALVLASCSQATPTTKIAAALDCRDRVVTTRSGSTTQPIWFSPTDDGSKQDPWCTAVGGVVVDDLALPESELERVYILSWNMAIGGGDLESLVHAVRDSIDELGGDSTHLVVLVQEAFRSSDDVPMAPVRGGHGTERMGGATPNDPFWEITESAEALGMSLIYAPSMRNGEVDDDRFREDRGNAILTSLPFSDVRLFELSFEVERRVAVAATMHGRTRSGASWCLRTVSVHLDLKESGGWGILSPNGRARQSSHLAGRLAGRTPTMIGGDLNTFYVREPALDTLRRHFPAPEEPPTDHDTTLVPVDRREIGPSDVPSTGGVAADVRTVGRPTWI